MTDTRQCSRCAQTLPLQQFSIHSDTRGRIYRRSYCAVCAGAATSTWRRDSAQKCRTCRKYRPLSAYAPDRRGKQRQDCTTCDPPVRARHTGYYCNWLYLCTQCGNLDFADKFDIDIRQGRSAVRSTCKECVRLSRRRYRSPDCTPVTELKSDLLHDFRFAVDYLGFSTERAYEWLAAGYKNNAGEDRDIQELHNMRLENR